jgi:hypothetical protein
MPDNPPVTEVQMSRAEKTPFLHEAVLFGGVPLKRGDVYLFCIADGFSRKDADAIAFGYANQTDEVIWPLELFKAMVAEVVKND